MIKTSCSIDGCDKKAVKRSWCHMHYLRWYRTGEVGQADPLIPTSNPAGRPTLPLLPRLMNSTQKTDTCWLWRGPLSSGGYGALQVDGRPKRVHRLAYELLVGPIPDGLVIDHLCRVRNCLNPAHLEPVTSAENTRRGETATKTHCKRGHAFTVENTYIGPPGWRACRTCKAAAKTRAAKKAGAARSE